MITSSVIEPTREGLRHEAFRCSDRPWYVRLRKDRVIIAACHRRRSAASRQRVPAASPCPVAAEVGDVPFSVSR